MSNPRIPVSVNNIKKLLKLYPECETALQAMNKHLYNTLNQVELDSQGDNDETSKTE